MVAFRTHRIHGFEGNLTPHEIAGQVLELQRAMTQGEFL